MQTQKFKGTPRGVPRAFAKRAVMQKLYLKAVSRQQTSCAKPHILCGLSALLVAVATGAVFAITGVADVDPVELTVHAVLVETALGDAAGNSLVDLFHIPLLLPYFAPFF